MASFDEQGRIFTEYLQSHAGEEPGKDRFYSGYITCIKDLLNAKPDMAGGKD